MNQDLLFKTPKAKPAGKPRHSKGINVWDAGSAVLGATNSPRAPASSHPCRIIGQRGGVVPDYALVYIKRGRGEFEGTGLGRQDIGEGDLLVLYPGVWYRYRPDPQTDWQERWVRFSGDLARRLMNRHPFDESRPVFHFERDEVVEALFSNLEDALPHEQGYEHERSTIILLLIDRLVQLQRNGNVMRRVMREILAHLSEPLDMERLAQDYNMSMTTFRRRFKQVSGVTPHEYLVKARVEKACRMLTVSRLTISEIARAVGFSCLFYFDKVFKRKQGCTPGDYLRSHRLPSENKP